MDTYSMLAFGVLLRIPGSKQTRIKKQTKNIYKNKPLIMLMFFLNTSFTLFSET